MWHRLNVTSCVLRLIGGSSSAPLLPNRHEIHHSPVPPLFTWPWPTSTPGRWCWTPGCHGPISCAPLSLDEGGGTRLWVTAVLLGASFSRGFCSDGEPFLEWKQSGLCHCSSWQCLWGAAALGGWTLGFVCVHQGDPVLWGDAQTLRLPPVWSLWKGASCCVSSPLSAPR